MKHLSRGEKNTFRNEIRKIKLLEGNRKKLVGSRAGGKLHCVKIGKYLIIFLFLPNEYIQLTFKKF